MKIAISASERTVDGLVDPRFGRARFFLIVDSDSGAVEVLDNSSSTELPHGAGIATVEALVRRGVTAVVTGQVGPKAETGLRAAGLDIRTGAAGTCREALAFLAPEVPTGLAGAAPTEA
jgi:predicted Fe-Mo cluster-binding NifX family protein